MQRSNSNSQQRGNSWAGRGRGGRAAFFSKNKQPASTNAKTGPVAQRSLNPLNQYFTDKFLKIKKDADLKGMQNQSFSYKRVLAALAKYPMPILCVD